MDKQERLGTINKLIKFMSNRGRRFFYNQDKEQTAFMKLKNNRVYFVDERTNEDVYAYLTNREPEGFSNGGTIWALVCEFSQFIRTGKHSNGVYGYGGLHGSGWGHSDEIQQEIIDYAKEIGYLK